MVDNPVKYDEQTTTTQWNFTIDITVM